MKKHLILLAALSVFLLQIPAQAETTKVITDSYVLASKVKGCDIDMKQHCSDVAPGQNRELLCLIAHEDKLLESCRTGIIESALTVQLGVAKLDYASQACGSDRVKLCEHVEAGGGRLLNCFKGNQSQLSAPCMTALQRTGLWNAVITPAAAN